MALQNPNLTECDLCTEKDILAKTKSGQDLCRPCYEQFVCKSCFCVFEPTDDFCRQCEGDPLCSSCSGSGEGQMDGSSCYSCNGSGVDKGEGRYE